MLIALESVPAANAGTWATARTTVLDRYLAQSLKDRSPPRFFLNDVVRYWRTLCVDYEGKMDVRRMRGWALRNAKLRLSRKMLFAGGLLPLLECGSLDADAMRGFLTARLSLTPADRVAAAFVSHEASEVGARTLRAYSDFLQLLDDADIRRRLEELPEDDHENDPLWGEVRTLGNEFQRGLDALLFETDLQATVREFAIF
jgi:hypothetical protein